MSFSSYGWEREKISKFRFHPSTNQCLLHPSITGEAGPGRFKGAGRREARRGWGEEIEEETVATTAVVGDAQAEKDGCLRNLPRGGGR